MDPVFHHAGKYLYCKQTTDIGKDQNHLCMTKMVKIDTLFKNKTAEKPHPLGPHIPLLYSWRFSRYSASFHWLVHGHMTSNNETDSRQMP